MESTWKKLMIRGFKTCNSNKLSMKYPVSTCIYSPRQPHRVNITIIPISEMENQACKGKNNHPPTIRQLEVSALGSISGWTDSRSRVWFPPKICQHMAPLWENVMMTSQGVAAWDGTMMWACGNRAPWAEGPGQYLHEPVSMSPGFPSQNWTPTSTSEGKTSTLGFQKGSVHRIRILSCPRRGEGGVSPCTGQLDTAYSHVDTDDVQATTYFFQSFLWHIIISIWWLMIWCRGWVRFCNFLFRTNHLLPVSVQLEVRQIRINTVQKLWTSSHGHRIQPNILYWLKKGRRTPR